MRRKSRYVNLCFFALWVKKLLGSSFTLDSQELGVSAIDEHISSIRDENVETMEQPIPSLYSSSNRSIYRDIGVPRSLIVGLTSS